MKEEDTLRLVGSLVVSRMAYGLSYANLNEAEMEKADLILRSAYKTAVRLSGNVSTEKLMALGISNGMEELSEAQWASHRNRLMQTTTGRGFLARLEFATETNGSNGNTREIITEICRHYAVAPIPKNMNPELHAGRRMARANHM